jgi:hypothetical protein
LKVGRGHNDPPRQTVEIDECKCRTELIACDDGGGTTKERIAVNREAPTVHDVPKLNGATKACYLLINEICSDKRLP